MDKTAHHAPASRKAHTTPKDFFLWLGAIIALYGSIISFLALVFDYVNFAFPDSLAYFYDPYRTGMRVAMASLVVLVPTMLGLLLTIRRDIVAAPEKANIWVRKWALVLTIFLAASTALIDLITLLTSFFGGELTTRFALKALVVLLIAVLATLHFLADLRGYWTLHRRKANMVGAAVGALAVMTVIGGFLIIGSPSHIRALRADDQRVRDLENIQGQVVSYWQQKQTLPADLEELHDPLSSYAVPESPEGVPYEYEATGPRSFTLCATFEADASEEQPDSSYAYPGMDSDWGHGAGRSCFSRTIDPERYPPQQAPEAGALMQ